MKKKITKSLFAGLLCLAFGIVCLSACSKSAETETATTEAESESTELTETNANNEVEIAASTEEVADSKQEKTKKRSLDEMTGEELYKLAFERGNEIEDYDWDIMYKSAQKGYVEAQEEVGGRLLFGGGDCNEMLKWLTKAAAQGSIRAMLDLGSLYESGFGMDCVKTSKEKAAKWYRKAAQLGDEVAKEKLKELGL